MSYAPKTISDLGALWTSHGGVNDGIVGNAAHTWGYHIGRDRIYGPGGQGAADYSVKLARDRAGLSNAAAALDLGKIGGSLAGLQKFSVWLVGRCRANAPGTSDIREIIYSPDGVHVFGYNREAGVDSAPIAGYGDSSHLWHTHISFYRDSEARGKAGIMAPYFAPAPPPPAPVHHELVVAANATVQVATVSAAGCIAAWTASHWGPKASSAPCGAPYTLKGCSSGSASVVKVTGGVYAGKIVRASGSGVSVK